MSMGFALIAILHFGEIGEQRMLMGCVLAKFPSLDYQDVDDEYTSESEPFAAGKGGEDVVEGEGSVEAGG